MTMLVLLAAALVCLCWIVVAADVIPGARSIGLLKDQPAWGGGEGPAVSVIIPARNERERVEEALASVLNQQYPHLEVIVVNDRSTDGTGEVLARLSGTDPRLTVASVRELPPGWIGKNHALFTGARSARGELLLFTDADVVMSPGAIGKAVRHLHERQLDHLTVPAQISVPGPFLKGFVAAFSVLFEVAARPWKARDPKSGKHVGVGSFNLVRTEVYHGIGGHQRIRLRPDDDMMLGKIVKAGGYRQDLLLGRDELRVEWYDSVGALIDGLSKIAYAGVGYSLPAAVAGTALLLLLGVWPFVALWVAGGIALTLSAVTVAIILLLGAGQARLHAFPVWSVLWFPAAVLLYLFILWRSIVRAHQSGGIDWRGTRYSLTELRTNRI